MAKLSIDGFVAFLEECLARKDGYIMGATGQDPGKWAKDSWWFTQYSGDQLKKALYWRENCKRVWDCQGLAEGYINDKTGLGINVRARNNYATWCSPKGSGSIPNQYKVPGAAVFIHSSSAGAITHVGYLVKPVIAGKPEGDWYVIEARGVMYGVVQTKLNSRPWNRWGLMTLYFNYDAEPRVWNLGDRDLSNGLSGDDVKQMQTDLISLGYDLGRWGADGEFGGQTKDAVNAFKSAYNLEENGIFDEVAHALLRQLMADDADPVEPGLSADAPPSLLVTGGSVYLRTGPGTDYPIIKVVRKGDRLVPVDLKNWNAVELGDDRVGYISKKYSEKEA